MADQGDREARGREARGREARGREPGSEEDLFQEFDDYFAPLEEEGEWPEEGREERPAGTPAAEDRPETTPPDTSQETVAGEVEPTDFDLDIPEPDELVADLPAEPEAPEPPPGAVTPPAPEPQPGPEPLEAAFDRAEAELGTEEGRGGEDLSVDDLRAPPPQYADLPGPEDEAEPSAAPPGEADEVSLEDLERLEEEEPVLAEEATFESLEGLPAAPELEEPERVEPPEEEAVEA
ncbi:MAG TPA: hypothetical protein VJ868_03965, partial [Actinomycetota bacterium]|nr:hypothetical protein [Actinomycetota bacterium]